MKTILTSSLLIPIIMWVMIRPSGKYAEWLKNKLKKDYLFALGFNTIISFIPFLIILLIKICF